MNLYYFCSSCKKENRFKTRATNRFELQEDRGNEINERCKYCGTISKRRINRVHAKANYGYIIAGLIVGLVLAAFLWQLGWIAGITFGLPIMIWQWSQKKATDFNKIRVSDTNQT